MKTNQSKLLLKSLGLLVITFFISGLIFAQENIVQDSTLQDSPAQEKPAKEKKIKKKRDAFKIYGGINLNDLGVSSDLISSTEDGYMLGVSYQRGKFFYYEIGARYNRYDYKISSNSNEEVLLAINEPFGVGNIDIPINGGINLTSFVSRLLGVRLFIGAVPTFNVYLDDRIEKDEINKFNVHAQGGLSLDVAFVFLEAGYNYGLIDLFKNDIKSNPEQIFVTLGFRF